MHMQRGNTGLFTGRKGYPSKRLALSWKAKGNRQNFTGRVTLQRGAIKGLKRIRKVPRVGGLTNLECLQPTKLTRLPP